MKAKLADCSVIDDVEFPVLGGKRNRSSCDLITKPSHPMISIFIPQIMDGWEEIEITVDLGACDTVLPSRMLPEVKLEET